jgi:hypothetical protein
MWARVVFLWPLESYAFLSRRARWCRAKRLVFFMLYVLAIVVLLRIFDQAAGNHDRGSAELVAVLLLPLIGPWLPTLPFLLLEGLMRLAGLGSLICTGKHSIGCMGLLMFYVDLWMCLILYAVAKADCFRGMELLMVTALMLSSVVSICCLYAPAAVYVRFSSALARIANDSSTRKDNFRATVEFAVGVGVVGLIVAFVVSTLLGMFSLNQSPDGCFATRLRPRPEPFEICTPGPLLRDCMVECGGPDTDRECLAQCSLIPRYEVLADLSKQVYVPAAGVDGFTYTFALGGSLSAPLGCPTLGAETAVIEYNATDPAAHCVAMGLVSPHSTYHHENGMPWGNGMYCRTISADSPAVWNGERWVYGNWHRSYEVRYYFHLDNSTVHNAFTIRITSGSDVAPANVTKVSSASGTLLMNEYDTVWAALRG